VLPDRTYYIEDDDQRDRIALHIRNRPLPFQLVVGRIRQPRSLDQNARLWLLHTEASHVTGYAPDEMHEFALMRHFGHRAIACGGIMLTVPLKRSSKLTIEEFTEFMERTEAWYASDFGVILPIRRNE
jgi:hypothetical protein